MTKTFTFPGCWVFIDVEGYFLTTMFHDGRSLSSVPVPGKDHETALRYGYGDDWLRLWREHDLLHHWVAVQFGHAHSPTIWSECHSDHPDALPRWARLQEEEFIADVHRWLNLDLWVPSLEALTGLRGDLDQLRAEARRLLNWDEAWDRSALASVA